MPLQAPLLFVVHYRPNSTAHCGGQLRTGRRRWWSEDSEIASYQMIGRLHGRRVGNTVMVAAIKMWSLIDCDSEEMQELKDTWRGVSSAKNVTETAPRFISGHCWRDWMQTHPSTHMETPQGTGGDSLCRRAFQEATRAAEVCPQVWHGSTNTWEVKAEGTWVWGHIGLHNLFQEQTKIPLIIIFRKDFPKTSLEVKYQRY